MMIVGNASTLYHDLNMQNLIYDKDFKVSKKTLRLTYGWTQLVLHALNPISYQSTVYIWYKTQHSHPLL